MNPVEHHGVFMETFFPPGFARVGTALTGEDGIKRSESALLGGLAVS